MPEPKKRKEDQQQPSRNPKQQQQKLQKITTYTGIAALVIVVAIVGYYLLASRAPTSLNPEAVNFRLDKQPSLGDPQAPIKVVEFADFKCPACKTFETTVFPQLKQDYIDTGKVQFFFINFPLPLGIDSYTAADAAECVYHQNEAAFWAYYRTVYQNQGEERDTWATTSMLLSLVQEHVQPLAGVNITELEKCIAEKRYEKDVEEDKKIGIMAGVTGTPTIFVNKKQVDRWWPYANVKAAIEKELNK